MKIRDRIRELRRVKASELLPHPKNWRTHPQAQQDAMRGLLAEIGWADAALVRETPDGLQLIDGHLRDEIAGDGEIPVLILDVTEAEAAKILGTHDPIAALAEANEQALGELLAQIETENESVQAMLDNLAEEHGIDLLEPGAEELADPEPQIDRAEELQALWKTEPGQLWTIEGKAGTHRLLCGDSTKREDVERVMGGEKAAIIATDPPYGINHPTEYKSRKRDKLALCRNYPRVAGDDEPYDPSGLLATKKPLILWGGNHYASRLPDSPGWLVWDKARPDDLDQATCELAWTNCIKGVRRIRHLWHGMIREGDDELLHPTQKPTAVIAWSLSLKWVPEGIVLDPYCGSGTTLVACEQLGRRGYGIEISPAYVAVALQRMKAITTDPQLAEGGA